MQTINCKGRLLSLRTPLVMGILNTTPDSFYAGSRLEAQTDLLAKAEQMLIEGADILDIGGYSTRPHAAEVSLEEELRRVIAVIEAIDNRFPQTIISIDTFRAEVAREAIQAGASIVNDVSGGQSDATMFETLAILQAPYVLTHSRGTPKTMNQMSHYEDILLDILTYFEQKIHALRTLGIKDIVLDLGFGFAKTIEQNFFLLKNLSYFHCLGLPMLVGISRKSMIYKTLATDAQHSLNGTTVLHSVALLKGAKILRVHDVKEAKQAVLLLDTML